MFPFGKKNKKTQHTQIGIVNSTDNLEQQIGIINIDDFQSNNSDNYDNSDDSQGSSIGILNEPGAINHGTQIDIQYNIDL